MSLSEGIIYYIFSFVLTLAFILSGCFIGTTLRKRKNLKLANIDSDNTSVNADEMTEEK